MNNYLIVAGGRGSDGQDLDVVEVYHTTHWTRIDRLPLPCSYMQTDMHSIFYLVGGDGAGQLHLLVITTNSHRWTVFTDNLHLEHPPRPPTPTLQ